MSAHLRLPTRLVPGVVGLALVAAAPLVASRPSAPVPVPGRPAEPPRLDTNGDPLPAGATARIGTLRFRHGSDVSGIVFAPDGRTVYTACHGDKVARAWTVADGREVRRFGGDAGVLAVAVSPDGKLVATGEDGNRVRLWEANTGREIRRIEVALPDQTPNAGRPPWVHALRFGSDGGTIVASYTQGQVAAVWSVASGQEVRRLTLNGQATAPAFSADGRRLAVATQALQIGIWELATGRSLTPVALSHDPANAGDIQVNAVALSPDGKLLTASIGDQTVRIWEADSGKELHRVQAAGSARTMAMAPNGSILAVAYEGDPPESGVVVLLDAATLKEVRRLGDLVPGTYALAFSPDGKTLATGGAGHTLRLWDAATGKEISPPAGHPGPLTTIAVSPDGRMLATCSVHDALIRLWDTATGREVRRLEGHTTGVDEVTFSPDGRLLASATWEQPVFVWEVGTGRVLHKLEGHAALGAYLRFADDNTTLATGGHANTIALWDCTTGKVIRELAAPPHGLASLLTFRDGRLLANEGPDPDDDSDMSIGLWDLTANRLVRRFAGHHGLVNSVILSADGRMLASRGSDKTIRVWEVASGGERRQFREPGDIQQTGRWTGTQFLAFAPDGRTLVSCASDDPLARRWDLTAGKEMPPLAGHRAWIGAVEFSANGRVLVTGSQDTTGLVWDGSAMNPRTPPTHATEAELTHLCDDLGERDAAKAYRAVVALAAAGDQAAAVVGSRLRPPPAADPTQIAGWIEALDHPQFAARERATTALLQVADQAEETLRRALERTRSAEVRQRVRRILDAARDVNPSADRLRDLRAIEVLEAIRTPAAREQLSTLARGASGAFLTREAQAALRRLQ